MLNCTEESFLNIIKDSLNMNSNKFNFQVFALFASSLSPEFTQLSLNIEAPSQKLSVCRNFRKLSRIAQAFPLLLIRSDDNPQSRYGFPVESSASPELPQCSYYILGNKWRGVMNRAMKTDK